MKTEQVRWSKDASWQPHPPGRLAPAPQLALVFGSTALIQDSAPLEEIRRACPGAELFGCSTAGEIRGTHVADESLVVTAVHFEHTRVQAAALPIGKPEDSLEVGRRLAGAVDPQGLRHAFVLSDGLGVNGSDLVRGLKAGLPAGVPVTGGLSGDGPRFERTAIVRSDGAHTGMVGILGFHGEKLSVGYGSLGGWDPFGPERLITRSSGNVLHELDGKSALALYKEYLGEHAQGLPATGLLFPLSLRLAQGGTPVVRTILSIDEHTHGMTFAGDMPTGAYARLMKANFDRLIDGATGAARAAAQGLGAVPAELAVLVSCVGRKLVLKQRVEEEVETVREVLGERPAITGFYSYGEICPFAAGGPSELHNQTMTITAFSEA